MVKYFNLFLFSILIYSNIFGQSVSVSASVDTTNYLVGDYIHYKLEVNYPEGTEIVIPEFQDSIKNVLFINSNPVITGDDGNTKRNVYSYTFSVYDSLEVTIPPVRVEFKKPGQSEFDWLESNEVSFLVTPMDVNPQQDIQDVKDPLKIPLDFYFVLTIVLIVLAILIAIYFAYLYYKKKHQSDETEKIIIKIPPHKEALQALYRLDDKKLWQQGLIKDYHSEITFIIRKYFERRFNFGAVEMTSAEILDELKMQNESQTIFDNTRNFFENADLVKFAKFQPMPTVNEEMMKNALEIVKVTKKEEVSESV